MHNPYVILRHGQSAANVAGIIVSNPQSGRSGDYTLTGEGEEQVRQSVSQAKEAGLLDAHTLIVTSPFSRCVRTAEIAKEILGTGSNILVDDRLRERWFGEWEETPQSNYEKVWSEDKKNPNHTTAGVESTREIQERALDIIRDLESRYNDRTILLVSHGDVLQILQTGLQEQSPALHRDIPYLKTAEVRPIEAVG